MYVFVVLIKFFRFYVVSLDLFYFFWCLFIVYWFLYFLGFLLYICFFFVCWLGLGVLVFLYFIILYFKIIGSICLGFLVWLFRIGVGYVIGVCLRGLVWSGVFFLLLSCVFFVWIGGGRIWDCWNDGLDVFVRDLVSVWSRGSEVCFIYVVFVVVCGVDVELGVVI